MNNKPIIYKYTRAQAMEDGYLLDLSTNYEIINNCFKIPVACTDTIWNLFESAIRNDSTQSIEGILHDLVVNFSLYISSHPKARESQRIIVPLLISGVEEKGIKEEYDIIIDIGPGDNREPVITIMTEEDD